MRQKIYTIIIVYLYLLAVFLVGPKKRKDLCSGWSLGMKFVNLSVIDEDAKNEIQSIHSNITYSFNEGLRSIFDFTENDENLHDDYFHHIIWAGDSTDYLTQCGLERFFSRRSEPNLFGSLQSLATILTRKSVQITNRENCIHLQKYGGSINGKLVKFSIGDDLENLLQRITSGFFMNYKYFRIVDSYHFYEMSEDELDLDHSSKSILHSLGNIHNDETFKIMCNKKHGDWNFRFGKIQLKGVLLNSGTKNGRINAI